MMSAENIKKHRDLIQMPEFRRATDVALAEMTKAICSLANGQDLTKEGVMQAAATSFMMIRGAHEFVEVLFLLAEQPRKPEPRKPMADELEHN